MGCCKSKEEVYAIDDPSLKTPQRSYSYQRPKKNGREGIPVHMRDEGEQPNRNIERFDAGNPRPKLKKQTTHQNVAAAQIQTTPESSARGSPSHKRSSMEQSPPGSRRQSDGRQSPYRQRTEHELLDDLNTKQTVKLQRINSGQELDPYQKEKKQRKEAARQAFNRRTGDEKKKEFHRQLTKAQELETKDRYSELIGIPGYKHRENNPNADSS